MVLAKNIYDANETLLMGKGTTLNAGNITRLSNLGLQTLWVEASGEKEELDSEEITRVSQEVEKLLESQFERVSHNPTMEELKRIFAKYLIKKGSHEYTKCR